MGSPAMRRHTQRRPGGRPPRTNAIPSTGRSCMSIKVAVAATVIASLVLATIVVWQHSFNGGSNRQPEGRVLLARERRANTQTRKNWALYAPHREVATRHITALQASAAAAAAAAAPPPPPPRPPTSVPVLAAEPIAGPGAAALLRLAIFGAGNCNDIDLSKVLGADHMS